jgi:hypothetical protein
VSPWGPDDRRVEQLLDAFRRECRNADLATTEGDPDEVGVWSQRHLVGEAMGGNP